VVVGGEQEIIADSSGNNGVGAADAEWVRKLPVSIESNQK